jgi:uncharacterized protein YegP (UPF0339 family)
MPGRQGKIVFFEDKAGKYRWHLKAPNGEIIADSGEGYSSFANCTSGFESVQQYSQNPETENEVEGKRYNVNLDWLIAGEAKIIISCAIGYAQFSGIR